MPTPVSLTLDVSHTSSPVFSQEMCHSTVPDLVYLKAFERILLKICFILRSSPHSSEGRVSSINNLNLIGFSSIRMVLSVIVSLIRLGKSYTTGFNSNFPVSIFEISRMSFIIPNKTIPAVYTFSMFSFSSPDIFPSRVNSDNPITALSGVRISWLIVARKVLLDFELSSAFTFRAAISS